MAVPRNLSCFRCNVPLFLLFIMIAYVYFTAALLGGSVLLSVVLSGLTLTSLFRASTIHPGPVAADWHRGVPASPESIQSLPYCKMCELHAPPRAHHCRTSGSCVARFDHFCDWIDNSIGVANHKLFVLFLLYIDLSICHFFKMVFVFFAWGRGSTEMAMSGRAVSVHGLPSAPSQQLADASTIFHFVGLLFYCMLILPCALFGMVFLISTVGLLIKNETTWESMHFPGRYDRGSVWANIQEVFGTDVAFWLLPTLPRLRSDAFGVGCALAAPPPHSYV